MNFGVVKVETALGKKLNAKLRCAPLCRQGRRPVQGNLIETTIDTLTYAAGNYRGYAFVDISSQLACESGYRAHRTWTFAVDGGPAASTLNGSISSATRRTLDRVIPPLNCAFQKATRSTGSCFDRPKKPCAFRSATSRDVEIVETPGARAGTK